MVGEGEYDDSWERDDAKERCCKRDEEHKVIMRSIRW